jgi:hypothetical protein
LPAEDAALAPVTLLLPTCARSEAAALLAAFDALFEPRVLPAAEAAALPVFPLAIDGPPESLFHHDPRVESAPDRLSQLAGPSWHDQLSPESLSRLSDVVSDSGDRSSECWASQQAAVR